MSNNQLERFIKALEARMEDCLQILEEPAVLVVDDAVIKSLNLFAQLDSVLTKLTYKPEQKTNTVMQQAEITENKGETSCH